MDKVYSLVLEPEAIKNKRGYMNSKVYELGNGKMIYLLLSKGELLYVGYSGGAADRIKGHLRGTTHPTKYFNEDIDKVIIVSPEEYRKFLTLDECHDVEAYLVKKLNPKYNIQYNQENLIKRIKSCTCNMCC